MTPPGDKREKRADRDFPDSRSETSQSASVPCSYSDRPTIVPIRAHAGAAMTRARGLRPRWRPTVNYRMILNLMENQSSL